MALFNVIEVALLRQQVNPTRSDEAMLATK